MIQTGLDLNDAGRAFLQHVDYRVGGIFALTLCVLLSVLKFYRFRTRPTISEFLNGVFGFISIYGGIVVATVFLLTKPPAVEYLSGADMTLAAIVTLVGTVYVGWLQLWSVFLSPPPPSEQPTSSDEK